MAKIFIECSSHKVKWKGGRVGEGGLSKNGGEVNKSHKYSSVKNSALIEDAWKIIGHTCA